MQKLPDKYFEYSSTSLDKTLNTSDDKDYVYYIACDIDYRDKCKDRTEQLALMPNGKKIKDNESNYREIKARTKQQNRIYGSL